MPTANPVSTAVAGLEARSEREIAILRATYHVMAREGSNRLALQAIADEAGISKGLVLYHFETKSAVLQHAMEWALLQTETRIREALEASAGRDLLAEVIDAILIDPERNRDFALVYVDLVEASSRDESFADLPAIVRGIIEGLYAEVITAGVERGELVAEDVAVAARRMRVVIDGNLLLWLQDEDWEASHGAMKAACLDMLRAVLASGPSLG